jgi:hypothetical protein
MMPPSAAVFGIVVIACNRPTITRTLDQLLRLRGDRDAQYPIVVSQVLQLLCILLLSFNSLG